MTLKAGDLASKKVWRSAEDARRNLDGLWSRGDVLISLFDTFERFFRNWRS